MAAPATPLAALRENVKTLVVPAEVPRVDASRLTALEFHRRFVARNTPCILTGALDAWPAMKRWNNIDYISRCLGERKVTIDWTPNGHGDCLTRDGSYFVIPASETMTFKSFSRALADRAGRGGVPYLQHQNGNFQSEFEPLWKDVAELRIAREAFGAEPDAINLWVGDSRSVSALHRDPYENIYCVVRGVKKFTLLPPTDTAFLGEKAFPLAQYQRDSKTGGFKVVPATAGETVRWIPVDPDDPKRFPPNAPCLERARPAMVSPVRCEVRPGEVLYLPSLWFHRVSQSGDCVIAVNFWYDMEFGARWALLQYLEAQVQSQGRQDTTSGSDEKENG